MTTFANLINSNPIYAKRAEADQSGVNIEQNYAKTSGSYQNMSVGSATTATNYASGGSIANALAGKQKTINIVTGAPIILDANGNEDLKISDGSFLDGLPESGYYETIGDKVYNVGLMPDGKIWMFENLDYKFEYNGSTLPIGDPGTPTTPAAWYYDNNEDNYGIDGNYKCGLLYNWHAVKYLNDNKATLIPGWHVASGTEWDALATAVGGAGTAGTKLKALDNSATSGFPSGWGGTDDYCFAAFPAGNRSSGSFVSLGSYAYFWTAIEYDSSSAYYHYFSTAAAMDSYHLNKSNGYSVRLVKD